MEKSTEFGNSIKFANGVCVINDIICRLESDIRKIYEPVGLNLVSHPQLEHESLEYGACRFSLAMHNIVFRQAKTTPTKEGQFVTVWKRNCHKGVIEPLDSDDGFDFIIIESSDESNRGHFIFPLNLLVQKGIVSRMGKGGKRAFRIYPPWSVPMSKQALQSQAWQIKQFVLFSPRLDANSAQLIKFLFSL